MQVLDQVQHCRNCEDHASDTPYFIHVDPETTDIFCNLGFRVKEKKLASFDALKIGGLMIAKFHLLTTVA